MGNKDSGHFKINENEISAIEKIGDAL